MNGNVVEAHSVTKVYDKKVVALKEFSMTAEKGRVCCLLGVNGAGKTTFLRIVSTELLPTNGEVKVLGYDIINDAESIRRQIAVVPQECRPYPLLTPYDHVYHYALLRGFNKPEAKKVAKDALEMVGLWGERNKIALKLSGGLRQRILVAMAIVTNAELMLLDEPTLGLDPIAKRSIWACVKELTKNGKTILLTTHDMEEAEQLSDKIVIINRGVKIAEGSPEEIRKACGEKVKIELSLFATELENDLLKSYDSVFVGDKLFIYVNNESEVWDILKIALNRKIPVKVSHLSLGDAFVKLVRGKRNEIA